MNINYALIEIIQILILDMKSRVDYSDGVNESNHELLGRIDFLKKLLAEIKGGDL